MFTHAVDAAIVITLVFFTWRGARKGLVLTLFSLFALVAAWYGASFVSSNFAKPVANIIRPSIQMMLDEALEDAFSDETPKEKPAFDKQDKALAPSASSSPAVSVPDELPPVSSDFTPQQILELLERSELFVGLQEYLDEAVRKNTIEVTTTATAAIAAYLAQLIANAGLFGITYLSIVLAWFLISRALDLAFKLPILAPINMVTGGLFGFTKGVILIMMLVWLAKLAGILTPENIGPVASMMTVQRLSELLHAVVTGG